MKCLLVAVLVFWFALFLEDMYALPIEVTIKTPGSISDDSSLDTANPENINIDDKSSFAAKPKNSTEGERFSVSALTIVKKNGCPDPTQLRDESGACRDSYD